MGRKQLFTGFVVEKCDDPNAGYSQIIRWGPSYDCASLLYKAAEAAGYPVPTSGTRYTGTMLRDFQNAGWKAVPFDGNLYDCEPGCIALNVLNHTEAFVDWGKLGGAHVDEHGGIQGCCPGDQTGNEISVGPAYIPPYGWDYILIPPIEDGSDEPIQAVNIPMPEYRVWTHEDGWLEWLTGLRCHCSCGDDFAGVEGHWIYDVEFNLSSLGEGGWYQLHLDGEDLPRNTSNTSHEKPITGVTVYYETPDPASTGYYKAKYRVGIAGGDWLKWEYDDEDGGAGGAGPIDRFQITLSKS